MSEMMDAVIVPDSGPLEIGQIAMPDMGEGDVMIEVKAAGLNRADLIQRQGAYPPPPGASKIMGLEVTGTISAVGADVTRWKVGDRVGALLAGGGYAQFAAVDAGSVLPLPDAMGFEEACCFPEAVFTVFANVYQRANLKSGEAFLCHGGTSGIGVMALQMAKHIGAGQIFATAGTDEKCDVMRGLGADHAINYKSQDFEAIVKENGGADVILGMVGGDYVQKNINVAKLNGRLVNIAYQNGFEATVNFAPVLMKRLSINATTLRARGVAEKRELRDKIEAQFWPAVMSGAIKPVLDTAFPMAEADAAQAKMAAGGHIGKIILTR